MIWCIVSTAKNINMNIAAGKVDTRIPKNKFRFAMPEVSAIIWRYKITKDTVEFAVDEVNSELQVIEVIFKGTPVTKYFSKLQSAIPYRMLFVYKEGLTNKYAFAYGNTVITTAKELLIGDELRGSTQSLTTLIEELAEEMLDIRRRETDSFDDLLIRQERLIKQKKEIARLQKLVDNEKQSKYRFKLNEELKIMQKELDYES
ncbi:MAG: hypothetical protein EOM87_04820 [Clostridia bacterium]|nr:hypothetical protein [Clostridia bacterium]